jgi:membrane dipeptidase
VGLSEFGKELVQRLNELKLIVDVAHVNRPGVLDACRVSKAPVIASHTNVTDLCKNNRGCTEEGIRAIASTGGLVGIIFCPTFLRRRLNVPLDAVVDHILWVIERVGAEHVAIGSDFDGWIPTIPNDIRDCRDLPWLSQRLLDRGATQEQVSAVLGGNFLRVLEAVRGS